MVEWVRSGYFKDNLLVKTIHEENFHALGEWTRILGNKVRSIFIEIFYPLATILF